jgi:plastocyanin
MLLIIGIGVSGCGKQVASGIVSQTSAVETGATGKSQAPDANGAKPGDVVVSLAYMRFVPAEIRVRAGGRVVFVNNDTMEHDVVQGSADRKKDEKSLFSSPVLQPGQSWAYTTTTRGEYPVICVAAGHYALGMTATLLVE